MQGPQIHKKEMADSAINASSRIIASRPKVSFGIFPSRALHLTFSF